ncbi:nitroreductase [Formosa agariphila KMM 3901]|uniref:Nitroreductase n=1 Tax=Formosa agariphila (strain DSM 15362 / KCTC 12365 / LMG 23005 / KMM 3901 / M-2Alg 35-1) TaxID=1347342 RepID=T2KP06_FORAG|nr:NAD(P)H-dependent oxidoreductase [Formosa agariphila]CDF80186.1 nitroreductase [Formosa agariphila KMM 3901]
MDIIKQLQWRYATKKFDNTRQIEDNKLQILLEAFNLTATSYGLQPVKLVVINNKTLQRELVAASMNQEQIAQASHVLVFCIETTIDSVFVENYFNRVQDLRETPDAVLKPFKDFLISDFENKEQIQIENWATKQAYLALGNMLTVCALEHIDACPMEGFKPDTYDRILKLSEKGLKSVLVLPIGYRASDDLFSELKKVRKPIADSIIHI